MTSKNDLRKTGIGIIETIDPADTPINGKKITRRRKFVVNIKTGPEEEYDNFITISAVNDLCDKVAAIQVGTEVWVQFRIQGRKYTSSGEVKYFNDFSLMDVRPNTNAPIENPEHDPPPPGYGHPSSAREQKNYRAEERQDFRQSRPVQEAPAEEEEPLF